MNKKTNKNLILIFAILILILSFSLAKPVSARKVTVDFGAVNTYTNTNNTNPNTYYPLNNTIDTWNTVDRNNPSPVINSIDPDSTNVGSKDITVTITGLDFISNSIAKWDNTYIPTTYIDSRHLVVTISAINFSKSGKYAITVFNPKPGGGTSNIAYFIVKTDDSSLTANALSSGFMPSLLQWLLLFLLILLIVIFARKILRKKKITLTASNITSTSVTLNATGLIPDEIYMLQVTGLLEPTKVQIIASKDKKISISLPNLIPGTHYTATISKYDPSTKVSTNIDAPVVYFNTLKYA